MKLSIISTNIPTTETLSQTAEHRLNVVMGRIAKRIEHVTLTLKDENGPKGGVDKRCCAKVSVRGVGAIYTEARHETVLASIDAALRRARGVILKRIKRMDTRARRQPIASAGLNDIHDASSVN